MARTAAPTPTQPLADAGQRAESLLRSIFEHALWNTKSRSLGDNGIDLAVSRGPHSYLLEIKAIPAGSGTPITSFWSEAALRARHHAREHGHPLAIVVANRITRQSAERLVQFAAQYLPDVALGIVDYHGLRMFKGAGLEALNAEPEWQGVHGYAAPKTSRGLFSDLNQWLLKVLLAPALPEKFIGAPRSDYRNATELSIAAKCSVMSAHRFIEQFKSNGFVDASSRRLEVVQRSLLLQRWARESSNSGADQAYRLLLKREWRTQLERYFPRGQACLGLFSAAHELGVGFVSGVTPYVLIEKKTLLPGGIDARPATNEFVAANSTDSADVIVRVPKTHKSVFRAQVNPKGVPSCDIIQVWLDVSNHGSRGVEQANMIWEKHLQKALGLSKHG